MAKYTPEWDENTYDITLSEGELRIITSAINSYAHAMLDQHSEVMENGICDSMGFVRYPAEDEIKDARRAIDRAFTLQEKLRLLYADE